MTTTDDVEEIVEITTLIPYQWNNKIHTPTQIDRIANSIQQFGFNQRIVIDEQSVILVGHGRFEAAKKLGLKEVKVLRKLKLTEAQKKAYRIVDNKTASDTSYNLDNLELDVRALQELNYDSAPFGFEEFKFNEPPAPPDEEEKKDEPPHDWVGQIKLKIPADEIDTFEAELDQLLKKFNNVSKETKRGK